MLSGSPKLHPALFRVSPQIWYKDPRRGQSRGTNGDPSVGGGEAELWGHARYNTASPPVSDPAVTRSRNN